jgi:ribosomal protein L22
MARRKVVPDVNELRKMSLSDALAVLGYSHEKSKTYARDIKMGGVRVFHGQAYEVWIWLQGVIEGMKRHGY